MKYFIHLALCCLFFFQWITSSAQQIISLDVLGEESKEALTTRFSFPAQNGIRTHKIMYLTTGIDNLPDTASGLFVLPTDGAIKGIIAYQHGTTDGPDDVPSNLNGGAALPIAYGGQGFAVCAADYLGLGDSRGFHPYLHAATEARAGIDMLLASIEVAAAEETFFTNIFVAGYSQGGHAAMALAQAIQERETDDLWLTAAAPMSGPYDLSGVMTDLVLTDSSYSFVAYMIYVVMGYQEVYGNLYNDISDIIRPQFLEDVLSFRDDEIGLFELNDLLIEQLVLDFGASIPSKLFSEEFIEAFTNDSTFALNVALKENDTYRWIPDMPMRLFYCTADEQVPFMNSLVAEAYMNENGAMDVQAFNLNSAASHAECALPAFLSSTIFFTSFVLTDVTFSESQDKTLKVGPIPSQGLLHLHSTPSQHVRLVNIFDGMGLLVNSIPYSGQKALDLSHLSNGVYYIMYDFGEHHLTTKFIIHK
ncbi:MAG: T9SS type A sorting domain-containing protein [Saprospiraceae bacterium]|nr:T9SS type A sorting domain-containing protein [Saprospiraceae bacterium]